MAPGQAKSEADVEMEASHLGADTQLPQEYYSTTSSGFEVIKPDPDGISSISSQHKQQQPPASSPAPSPEAGTTTTMKAPAATKKRGTAAASKRLTGKRSRGGPRSRTAKSSKSATSAAGKSASGGEGNGAEGGGSSDDETDNGPYCLCRGPDDHRWMISCDVCEDWFHGECVDLAKEVGEKLVERFVCPNCTDGKKNYTKYRKTCSLPGCTDPARLYGSHTNVALKSADENSGEEKSVFCSDEHRDAWWASMIATLPTKAAAQTAIEVLTQEDFLGLLAATPDKDGWTIGDKPFGNIPNLWSNGLPTLPGVLSEEETAFLQNSAAERLALGNEIVQYKKMMQLLDWANARRQAAIEAGRFTKDSCGYDYRLDTVSVRVQFAAWLDTAEGRAVFASGRLDAPIDPNATFGNSNHTSSTTTTITNNNNDTTPENNNGANASTEPQQQPQAAAAVPVPVPVQDPLVRGMCDRKRCKPHAGWYKLLMSAVRVLVKETATAAATKLEAEEAMRQAAAARFERRQRENNWVEVLDRD
ncbi:hypothetical protein F5Y17DRAFT_432587 [Xylariaceae sp. FL0594]|nr:hypothetical protein F5Y17DRAFT_432587 [Xylariaceae sp. FL0594]